MKKYLLLLLLLLLLPSLLSATPRLIRHAGGIPNRYIVVLHAHTPPNAVEGIVESLESSYAVQSAGSFQYSLQGFLAIATEQQVTAMLADPRVEYIEQDSLGTVGMPSAMQFTWYGSEYVWHLDRLDDRDWGPPAPGNPYGRDGTYYECPEGSTVYAYVIDTGVWNVHSDLAGRLVKQLDFSADQPDQSQNNPDPPDATNACANTNPTRGWHGTAVASVLAGAVSGASNAKVVSLKIAQCNANGQQPGMSAGSMIRALDWINSPRNDFRDSPGVINFSGFFFQFDVNQFPSVVTTLKNTVQQTQFPFFTSADNTWEESGTTITAASRRTSSTRSVTDR